MAAQPARGGSKDAQPAEAARIRRDAQALPGQRSPAARASVLKYRFPWVS